MSEILSGVETQARVRLCPKCGSASISTVSQLAETSIGTSTCESCGWTGSEKDLITAMFRHGFKSDQEILEAMMKDLRNILSKSSATAYGRFLLKWGFMDMPVSPTQLARYLEVIATSSVTAVIELRKKMEQEKLSGSSRA